MSDTFFNKLEKVSKGSYSFLNYYKRIMKSERVFFQEGLSHLSDLKILEQSQIRYDKNDPGLYAD